MEKITKTVNNINGKLLFCFIDNKLHIGLQNGKDSFEHSVFKKINDKHEKETLFEVIKLRDNMTIKEKSEANSKMNENFQKINIVAENYLELKFSENYKTLQQSIADVEEHLQAARRLYNSNVSLYNQLLVSFPSSVVAKNKNLTKRDFFEIEETKKMILK